MSKKTCYFKCPEYEGPLFNFPLVTYKTYEKYCKWKTILRKKDRKKEDHVIQNFKLCANHFEKHYIVGNRRLQKHALPTIIHGITFQQEELLCSFIEKYSKLIMGYNLNGEMVEEVIEKWKVIAPELNKLGPEKSHSGWAEFLYDLMSNLKRKKVIWNEEVNIEEETEVVSNSDDFSELELKILNRWRREMVSGTSSDQEINVEEENDVEYMIEFEGDNSSDNNYSLADNRHSGTGYTQNNIDTAKEIVTFTLNLASGGHNKPLLQAADISPYEASKDSNGKCKCQSLNGLVEDQFDAFGKEIAQQLRSMPVRTAQETKQLLKSVIRIKRKNIK